MKSIMKLSLLFLVISFCLGCQSENQHTIIKPIKNGVWYQDSTLQYSIHVKLPQNHLDFLYQVQYSKDYPFENIWLDYSLFDPNGKLLANSRDNLGLFESRTGRPFGEGTDERRFLDAFFLRNIKLSETGEYRLKVKHYMRPDSIPGIQSIGLKIRPHED